MMPASAAGHGAAVPDATASSQIGQQNHRAASPSRQQCTTPVSPLAGSSPSSRPRNPRQPPCRRQIPIDRTGRTAAPDPPAVSSPEPCPTPAALRKAPLPPRRGRCPTTLNKSRRRRGKIHYQPSRALWVHALASVRFIATDRTRFGVGRHRGKCSSAARSGIRSAAICLEPPRVATTKGPESRFSDWTSWPKEALLWGNGLAECAAGPPAPAGAPAGSSGAEAPRLRRWGRPENQRTTKSIT